MIFTPENVILGLKIAVSLVTILLLGSLLALAKKKPKWHGYLNTAFFILTLLAVLSFEVIIRLVNPHLTESFSPEQREALRIHLNFSIPSAIMLPAMLYTGKRRLIRYHVPLACIFLILWIGTFVTGIFYLPHSFEPLP